MTPKHHVESIDAEITRIQKRGAEKHGDAEHYDDHLRRLRSTRLTWTFLFPEAT
jgi:hypothetical protein